ncbi:galactonate dehydratase [Clostridium grantii]|uniref:Galactonate dehydratase n=1 Tax=Clostridium grantii DSM 8605 TaxID=1121316 RepID=A0A1M5WBJ1_9CLOT|nr:galactonate dehydratase [Clostridium grantii]SHH84564.1 galactonate dehydratase [Clostridium grantii DSM 8605]
MRITNLETFHVKPRWLFLKILTDEGIVGYGEPVIEGQSKIVEKAVHSLGKLLIGKNPCDIEYLWQLLYRGSFYRGGPILVSAISGIEQALWDIKGKYYKMPVYEMLGGKVRNKIRVYPHIDGNYPNDGNTSTERFVECALKRKKEGFNFVKLGLPDESMKFLESPSKLNEIVEKFAKVREAVGDDMDIAVDCHGRMSTAMAIRFCKALEPYNPAFIEEPVLPENVDALVKVKEATSIPIAAGERRYTKWQFRELLEKQAVAIVQPDCCHAGGILEVKKIAAMAETYYCGVAPHNPLGPISLAACLQVDACTSNFFIQEFPAMYNGWDRGEKYLAHPFQVNNGYIDVPKGHGLGIQINEDSLREMSYDGEWETPLFFDRDDNSMADW